MLNYSGMRKRRKRRRKGGICGRKIASSAHSASTDQTKVCMCGCVQALQEKSRKRGGRNANKKKVGVWEGGEGLLCRVRACENLFSLWWLTHAHTHNNNNREKKMMFGFARTQARTHEVN